MNMKKTWLVGVIVMASVLGGLSEKGWASLPEPEDKSRVEYVNNGKLSPASLLYAKSRMSETCDAQARCRILTGNVLYVQQGADYADYPYGAAFSKLYLVVDEQRQARDYWLDVYDQDEHLAQRGVTPGLGDQLQMMRIGAENQEAPGWAAVTFGAPVRITQEPTPAYLASVLGLAQPNTMPAGLLFAVSGLGQARFEYLFNVVSGHYRSSISHGAR